MWPLRLHLADALLNMHIIETTCQIQLAAHGGGTVGAFVWPALVRTIDRIDTGWRA